MVVIHPMQQWHHRPRTEGDLVVGAVEEDLVEEAEVVEVVP